MALAYVLIVSETGAEGKIVEDLSDTEKVRDVDVVYGEYDIIAKVALDDISQLGDFVLEKVRTIFGVRRTSTLIVSE